MRPQTAHFAPPGCIDKHIIARCGTTVRSLQPRGHAFAASRWCRECSIRPCVDGQQLHGAYFLQASRERRYYELAISGSVLSRPTVVFLQRVSSRSHGPTYGQFGLHRYHPRSSGAARKEYAQTV